MVPSLINNLTLISNSSVFVLEGEITSIRTNQIIVAVTMVIQEVGGVTLTCSDSRVRGQGKLGIVITGMITGTLVIERTITTMTIEDVITILVILKVTNSIKTEWRTKLIGRIYKIDNNRIIMMAEHSKEIISSRTKKRVTEIIGGSLQQEVTAGDKTISLETNKVTAGDKTINLETNRVTAGDKTVNLEANRVIR